MKCAWVFCSKMAKANHSRCISWVVRRQLLKPFLVEQGHGFTWAGLPSVVFMWVLDWKPCTQSSLIFHCAIICFIFIQCCGGAIFTVFE